MVFNSPFRFEYCYSVIRIYRDVFLLFDDVTDSRVLSRIMSLEKYYTGMQHPRKERSVSLLVLRC